jgi:hypothetical protein
MYRVVHCHYCYANHSQLESYPFDDHDHAPDHVMIDVLLNLDDRVMYDAQDGVQLNVNDFYLNMTKSINRFQFYQTNMNTYDVCAHDFDFVGDL